MRTIFGQAVRGAHHIETTDGWTIQVARGARGRWHLIRVYDTDTCICDACLTGARKPGA